MKILTLGKMLVFGTTLFFGSLAYSANASDADIVANIKERIAADKSVSDLPVKISSQAGVVTLKGHANTDVEAEKLIQISEDTQGVSDVNVSELTVKQSKHNMSDVAITSKVKGKYMKEKLFGDKPVSVMNVHVETTNGIVYLTGSVETQSLADNAVKLAESVKGVKKVESKLEVKPNS